MNKYIEIGETIEGEYVDIKTRRLDWKGIVYHPITNQRMTLYELDLNSEAKIIKECTNDCYSDDIKEATKHFHRNLGDYLEAKGITLYSKSIKKIKFAVKEGQSGRHGAQLINMRDRSISEIKKPIDSLRKCLGLTSNLPNK